MEKYLKMEDYFDAGDVLVDGSSLHDASGVVAKVFGHSAYASYVSHAINSHDELVAMNKELLMALEAAVGLLDHFGDSYGCDPSNYIEYKMAVTAIAKAKAAA